MTIQTSAFAYNPISNLIISNGVTKIERYAFENNQLTSVTIPSSVEYIGRYAFDREDEVTVAVNFERPQYWLSQNSCEVFDFTNASEAGIQLSTHGNGCDILNDAFKYSSTNTVAGCRPAVCY